MPSVVLLGPQARAPTVATALRLLGVSGPPVAVTAGWEEREAEVENLEVHLGRDVVDLRLHGRADALFAGDAALLERYRERRQRLRDLQRVYRVRLDHLVAADQELAVRAATSRAAAEERQAVLAAVRALDLHHVRRLRDVLRDFEASLRPVPAALAAERRAVRGLVQRAGVVLVAGGHVGVLLNRLRLFALGSLLRRRPVVAWSAGAMTVCRSLFLFHDDPPHGRGTPEAFAPGLGLVRGVVALPGASRRLRLDDAGRVAHFAGRLAPRVGAVLDEGAGALFDGRTWHPVLGGARRLGRDGRVVGWEVR